MIFKRSDEFYLFIWYRDFRSEYVSITQIIFCKIALIQLAKICSEEFRQEKDLERCSVVIEDIKNKVNWGYCKHLFIWKQWYLARLNLEKAIFKQENKTTSSMNDHLWCLKFVEYRVQELKKLCCWGRWRKCKLQ